MKITWIANFIIHILNQRILIQIGVKMRWVSGITMFYHQTFLKLPVWQQFIISKGHFQKCESCIHDFITFHETNSKSPWKWMLGWEFAYFSGSKMHEHHGGQKPFSSRLTSSFLFGIPTIRRHGLVRAIGAQWWGTCDAAHPGVSEPENPIAASERVEGTVELTLQ